MENRLDNEYTDSKISVNKESGIGALPEDLYKTGVIDWLLDEIDVFNFHNDEDFLDFVRNSGFDKIYYISVYPNDISKYKDVKSVYDLLERKKSWAGIGKLYLVIFHKSKDLYNTKEETDKLISDYADEYVVSNRDTMNGIINIFEESGEDVSNLGDSNIRQNIIKTLSEEPQYGRILSNGGKYKYIFGGGKGSHPESGKYYINLLKEKGIDMVEI